MSDNRHYSVEPASFLVESIELLPRGRVLDVACGNGRNALYLAQRGYAVEGVDRSEAALRELVARAAHLQLSVDVHQVDLESNSYIIPNTYNGIVVFNYLQRSLAPHIVAGLRAGGVLIYETFIVDQAAFGKPTNPDYLLKHNELLRMFGDLRCLRYREGVFAGPRAIASLVAEKVQ